MKVQLVLKSQGAPYLGWCLELWGNPWEDSLLQIGAEVLAGSLPQILQAASWKSQLISHHLVGLQTYFFKGIPNHLKNIFIFKNCMYV